MYIEHSPIHPSFCDPRLCEVGDGYHLHRDAAMVLVPAVDDVALSVSLGRFDTEFDGPAATRVHLDVGPPCSDSVAGAVLTPAEARQLALELVDAAHRAELAALVVAR